MYTRQTDIEREVQTGREGEILLRMKPVWLAVAATAVFVFGVPSVSHAQKAAKAKPVVKATHGDWQIQCDKAKIPVKPAQEGGEVTFREVEQCGMVQLSVDKTNKNVGIKVAIFRGKDAEKKKDVVQMQVVAPLGVFLPNGIAIEIDGKPFGRFPFISCPSVGCLTVVPITPKALTAMQKGSKANMIIYRNQAQGIGLALSLKGFSKAYGSLGS